MTQKNRKGRNKIISRDLITDHAVRLFDEKGVEATSINAIVRAAGIAKGTFYLYFEDKNDLVEAVLSRYTREFLGEVILPNRQLPRIKDLAGDVIDYFSRNRLYLEELRKNLSSSRQYQSTAEAVAAFAEVVRDFLNPQDDYEIGNWDVYTRVLLGMILDVCHKALTEEETVGRKEAEEMLGDVLKRFFSCA